VLGDEVLGLLLGLKILGDPFPVLGFGRRDLYAPALGMLMVTWRYVLVLPQLTSKTCPEWPIWLLLSRIKDT
jgi:hypothetical protein